MRVYLVRHGDALPGPVDAERELSPKGFDDMKKVAKFLKSAGVKVPIIFHSGLKRALQTAEIISKTLGGGCRLAQKKSLAPEDSVVPVVKDINSSNEDVMIVGHLPHLSNLLSMLILGIEEKDLTDFKKGAVVLLEREGGTWSIKWVVTPKLL